ncbi:MAG: polysaccharide biosynthesis protein [Candidatus Auribacterota bacterium]|jgi:FlaA1/EpsC-like NDP-sugar epimerase|nr:polysaccharide biosynthesis protein [Candidatus Auribacterota bacterium]
MHELFEGKKILVTGGAGSIGSEIVRSLLQYNPAVIRVYSRGESEQFDLQHELKRHNNIRYLVGDVRDKARLAKSFKGIDYVFHAAALKHVPACEYNPFEAVKTNVIGTENVIEVASEEGVSKVISISTDKACSPTNVMGATKLLAERLIAAANYSQGTNDTIFASVRFGNVMGSRGSVIPLFYRQITQGGPVTITDPSMTRFMMTIPQAIKLVFEALRIAQGGEIFILKMPALRLLDLAEVMIEEIAPLAGFLPCDIEMKYIGSRPGEKLYEGLLTSGEAKLAVELDDMFILSSRIYDNEPAELDSNKTVAPYTSNNVPLLDKHEIKRLLQSIDVVPKISRVAKKTKPRFDRVNVNV